MTGDANTQAPAHIHIASDYRSIPAELMGVALLPSGSGDRRVVINVFHSVPTPKATVGKDYELVTRLTAMAAVSMDLGGARQLVVALNRVIDIWAQESSEEPAVKEE